MTTKQLAKSEGVKVKTIYEHQYMYGHFRGWFVTGGRLGRQYTWERKSE